MNHPALAEESPIHLPLFPLFAYPMPSLLAIDRDLKPPVSTQGKGDESGAIDWNLDQYFPTPEINTDEPVGDLVGSAGLSTGILSAFAAIVASFLTFCSKKELLLQIRLQRLLGI
jgi:hypothetical protein